MIDRTTETIHLAALVVENLQEGTKVREILHFKGYGDQAIEEARQLLWDISQTLKEPLKKNK